MTPIAELEGTDQFDAIETKLDQTIVAVNAIGTGIDGGTVGQVPRKLDSTDFNFEWVLVPTLEPGSALRQKKRLTITDWNCDTTDSKDVAHGLTSAQWKTMRVIGGSLRNDADTMYYPLGASNNSGNVNWGPQNFDATNLTVVRRISGPFDDPDFNSVGGYVRAYIDIEYTP